jgi:glycosyltransferase involved in cell wall biosynthesis
MKIIFIPHLPSLYGRRYQISKELVKQGHEVHFIMWGMPFPLNLKSVVYNIIHSWRKEEYKKDGIQIHKIRRLPFFIPIINKPWFKRQIRKLYEKYGIDIIFSQSFINEIEPPLDLPLIYDMNDDHIEYANIYGSPIYRLSSKILQVKKTVQNQIKNAKCVIAVSDILVNKAKKYNKKVYKITNGVDEEFLKKHADITDKNSIIFVSNFGKWSKLLEIIEAIKNLKTKYPNIRLMLVGDGTEIPIARKKVNEYGLEKNVIFYGKIEDRKKIIKLIQSAEVCLNISDKNAFRDAASPIKYFEYSALGKKIISINLKEIQSLKFPNTLILKDDQDIKELENLIIKSFNYIPNEKKAITILKHYSWTNIVKKMEKIIKKGV